MITNQNKIKRHKLSKLVIVCTILTMLSYVFFNIVTENVVHATQTREPYSSKINNYPGYTQLIENLKKSHPNWNFTIFYTGLDWAQVIKNETSACHGRNVVPKGKSSAWKCSVCGETPHGGSGWRCASEAAVCYYMDPRNWLNDTYIFQFENLSYNKDIQTIEGVQKIISSMQYMQGNTVTYTKTDGTQGIINKSYAQIIMEAAQEAGISPLHLASRLHQEQGGGQRPGSTATGTYPGYTGYYNYLNIKASGSNDSQVIANGLEHAKKNGWTDPEISIKAGASILAKNYINDGQDTIYLQKFDVDNSDGTLYYFQYMQNVSVCLTEGSNARKAYEEAGFIDNAIEFVIPVYENMPETPCQEPRDLGVVTQNVKVKGNNVSIREGTTTSSARMAWVNTGDTLLRIEMATTMNGGYYWDKVVLPDGRKGYIARNYIVEVADITNCNDTVVANTSVNLRNGPGTSGTTIITMLTKGQVLTRIETGKYNNIDGYNWDRVKLADGRQGYIAQNYIELIGANHNPGNATQTELIKIICNSGLKVREAPGTNQKVLTYLDRGNILTRVEAGVSNANGYVWDKIVTADGIEGYIARGTASEQYIEVVNSNAGNNPSGTTNKNNKFKLEDTTLICEPQTTVEVIKEKYTDKEISVKNAEGTIVTEGNIATGYHITIEGKNYTIIKMGDINGDGKITPADSTVILRAYVGLSQLSDIAKLASDTNKDGKITPADSTVILRAYVGLTKIEI